MLSMINKAAELYYAGKYKKVRTMQGAKLFVCTDAEERAALKEEGVYAFTVGTNVYFREKRYMKGGILRHELEHVKQARESVLFPLVYWWYHYTAGYWNNPYEVAARSAERY